MAKPKQTKEKKSTIEKVKKGKGQFHLNVSVNGENFYCDTDNIADSLLEINLPKLTTKAIVTVTKGDLKYEKFYFGHRAKLLFTNKITAGLFAKFVQTALK